MKIQTNAGEQELTAEMVRKGMVFRWGRTTFTIADPDQDWITAEERVCGRDLPQRADRFLGCDPAIASRADCERFGVHGDAAAHGFARLRDGGAVDLLRTLPRGATYRTESGTRFLRKGDGGDGMLPDCIFVGLDAEFASPEDVRRLCCGADHPDIGGFVASCSLAIGPHDEHEDLATGVKWSAGAERYLSDAKNGPCHIGVDPAQPGTEATAFVSAAMRKAGESLAALGEAAKHAAESAMPVPAAVAIKWEMGTASLGQSQAHVMRDGDVCRWQVNHLGLRIREGVEPHASPAMQRAGDLLRDVHAATAGIEWLAGFFGLLFRIHDATPAAKRAKQEAPLVALVAAVPEGLDPIGWRAAVLACVEHRNGNASDVKTETFYYALLRAHHQAARGETKNRLFISCGNPFECAVDSYLRAIAPAPKVTPERLTWKTRGPVLPCDNGEDE